VLNLGPSEIFRVRRRVADLAASLNVRTSQLLTAKWMPRREEVAGRHQPLLRAAVSMEV
jgi:hypothetical protein